MISIIVLNYNDSNTVIQFLKTFTTYRVINKIIVVDNCSTDNSWSNFENNPFQNVIYLKNENNNGYGAGNNVGIHYLLDNFPDTDKIIISNPDVYISELDLIKICDALDNGFAMSTGLIYNSNSDETNIELASNWCWDVPKYRDMIINNELIIYKFLRKYTKLSIYKNLVDYKLEKYIPTGAVPGCFFAIKTNVMREINLFDERTFLFGEETILGYKLFKIGKKVCVVNNTRILHKHSTSINKSIKEDKKKNEFLLNSQLLYLREYLNCNSFQIFLFIIFFKIGILERYIVHSLRNIFKNF